jgi:DNA-directed RNA polymerase subunit RPC12/RpoP
MFCPQCGGRVHRSHSRNFRESAIKVISSYRPYRCSECGWRAIAAPERNSDWSEKRRMVLFWTLGLILALAIAGYAVYDLQSALYTRAN